MPDYYADFGATLSNTTVGSYGAGGLTWVTCPGLSGGTISPNTPQPQPIPLNMEEVMQEIIKQAEVLYNEGVEQTKILRKNIDEKDNFLINVPKERLAMVDYLSRAIEYNLWEEALLAFDFTKSTAKDIINLAQEMQSSRNYSVLGECFIVILTNPNSHSYKLNVPYKTEGSRNEKTERALTPQGDHGDCFPLNRGSIRAATNEEIARWVSQWLINEIKHLPLSQQPKGAVLTNYLEALNATLKGG
uniref:Uncharacterized protein n=1 Tax=viral metagenome TaxID=1070528 RepID=A0A6H1ZH94_9ZZZZ